MIIRLPFPAAELFPNKKNGRHWSVTHKAKTKQKEDAFWLTEQAAGEWEDKGGYIPLSLLYLTPDRRHRDCDNLLAASKAMLDGIAIALAIDDKRFKPILIDWAEGPKEGALVVAIGVQITSGVNLE